MSEWSVKDIWAFALAHDSKVDWKHTIVLSKSRLECALLIA